jgi:DNA-binding transcriptional regulator YiaG
MTEPDMTEGYHYPCGLDYIYLLDGYTTHETAHGRGVAINDARKLHERIALDVISRPHPLRGQEVRFLRSMLKVSQEGLARVLGQRRGSVARWEGHPNKDIPGAADSALRMFYALKAGGHETAQKIVDLLQEEDELRHRILSIRDLQLRKDVDWVRAPTPTPAYA